MAGLHHQQWGVLPAAQRLGYQVDTGSIATSFTGATLSLLPGSYDEMLSYDVVVLTGIDANGFGDFGREMLLDFVKAGGRLLVFGGFYSYGEGGYAGTQFDELPFKSGEPFTLLPVEEPGEAGPRPPGADPGAPVLADRSALPVGAPAGVEPGAEVWMTMDGKPFLTSRQVGKGQVMACLGTILGEAPAGQRAFWDLGGLERGDVHAAGGAADAVGYPGDWRRSVRAEVPVPVLPARRCLLASECSGGRGGRAWSPRERPRPRQSQ